MKLNPQISQTSLASTEGSFLSSSGTRHQVPVLSWTTKAALLRNSTDGNYPPKKPGAQTARRSGDLSMREQRLAESTHDRITKADMAMLASREPISGTYDGSTVHTRGSRSSRFIEGSITSRLSEIRTMSTRADENKKSADTVKELVEIAVDLQGEESALKQQINVLTNQMHECKRRADRTQEQLLRTEEGMKDRLGAMVQLENVHELEKSLHQVYSDLQEGADDLEAKEQKYYKSLEPLPPFTGEESPETRLYMLVKHKFQLLEDCIVVLKKRLGKCYSDESLDSIIAEYGSINGLNAEMKRLNDECNRLALFEAKFDSHPLLTRRNLEIVEPSFQKLMIIGLQNELSSCYKIIEESDLMRNEWLRTSVVQPRVFPKAETAKSPRSPGKVGEFLSLDRPIDVDFVAQTGRKLRADLIDNDIVNLKAQGDWPKRERAQEAQETIRNMELNILDLRNEIKRLESITEHNASMREQADALLETMREKAEAEAEEKAEEGKKDRKNLRLHKMNRDLLNTIAEMHESLKAKDEAIKKLEESNRHYMHQVEEKTEECSFLSGRVLTLTQANHILSSKLRKCNYERQALYRLGMSTMKALLKVPLNVPEESLHASGNSGSRNPSRQGSIPDSQADPSVTRQTSEYTVGGSLKPKTDAEKAEEARKALLQSDPDFKYVSSAPEAPETEVFSEDDDPSKMKTSEDKAMASAAQMMWRDGVYMYLNATRSAIDIQRVARGMLAKRFVNHLRKLRRPPSAGTTRTAGTNMTGGKRRSVAARNSVPKDAPENGEVPSSLPGSISRQQSEANKTDLSLVAPLPTGGLGEHVSKANNPVNPVALRVPVYAEDSIVNGVHLSAPPVRCGCSFKSTEENLTVKTPNALRLISFVAHMMFHGGETVDVLARMQSFVSDARAEINEALKPYIALIMNHTMGELELDRRVLLEEIRRLGGRPKKNRSVQTRRTHQDFSQQAVIEAAAPPEPSESGDPEPAPAETAPAKGKKK